MCVQVASLSLLPVLMVRVLNVIQTFSLGGAVRAVYGTSKYSSLHGNFHHAIVSLAPEQDDPKSLALAEENGLEILRPHSHDELMRMISAHDIVLMHWWNSPQLDNFIRTPLPAARLAAWVHVGGQRDPQALPDGIVSFLDFTIAGSPFTHEGRAFSSVSVAERDAKTTVVYDATDFAKLSSVYRAPHDGFNVGYIGTVDFSKMHPEYVRMSAAANIPNVKFIVCGAGGEEETIRRQAQEIQRGTSFDVRGFVHDIAPVLSILDAYGYPLCEDNYAAAELNLQEVMYCGIPPVVFPYGGVRHLVIPNVTGYVVHSEREYVQALEHLYQVPEDRARIGANAAEYARQIFGAERAALKFNSILSNVMRMEKRQRLAFSVKRTTPPALSEGARRFTESLQSYHELFINSVGCLDDKTLFDVDAEIMKLSPLMKRGGIRSYRQFYQSDPNLCFWAGLCSFAEGDMVGAIVEFVAALQHQFAHWRSWWYLGQVAYHAGYMQFVHASVKQIKQLAPHFEGVVELQRWIDQQGLQA